MPNPKRRLSPANKMGRVPSGKVGEKLNLWIEKASKDRLRKLAFLGKRSLALQAEYVIDEAYKNLKRAA